MDRAWTYTAEDALAHFGTNGKAGLNDEQVENSRTVYGLNGRFGLCRVTNL